MNELPQEQEPRRFPLALLVGLIAVVFLLGFVGFFSSRPAELTAPASLPFSDSEQAYAKRIRFTGIQMSRAKNFLGHEVTVIAGTIENLGNQDIREMTFAVEFRDFPGQVVLREEVRYPDAKMPPIAAGRQRDFVFNFEKVPAAWSQQYPQFPISGLRLAP